nr:MAG TPA: hypothetical protein [Caudoviricetes sp.]
MIEQIGEDKLNMEKEKKKVVSIITLRLSVCIIKYDIVKPKWL